MTRRRVRQAAVMVAVLVTAVGLWWVLRPSPLQRARAGLDASDPGWRFADIHAARLAAQPTPDPLPQLPAEYITLFHASRRGSIGRWGTRPGPGQSSDPKQAAAWRAAAPVVPTVRRLVDRPPGLLAADPATHPNVMTNAQIEVVRPLGLLLQLDAVEAAAHGDAAGAADSVRAMLALARATGRRPDSLWHRLRADYAGWAVVALRQALATTELPADALAAVHADLATEADPAVWADAVRDWRAEVDHEFEAVTASPEQFEHLWTPARFGSADRLRLQGIGLRLDHADCLRAATELLAIARRPAHEWAIALAARPALPGGPGQLLAHRQLRDVRGWFAAAARHQAVLRTAVLAVGCERFRLRHGRWPGSLDELPADLAPGDRTDPFDGRPLTLVRTGDGLTVASGFPPAGSVGFRLWDPAARRP